MSVAPHASVRQLTRRVVGAAATLAAALAVTVAAPAGAQAAEGFELGVTMPGVPGDSGALQGLTDQVGRAPDLVMWYIAWSGKPAFPAGAANQVAATGAVPSITWEPWDPAGGVRQPRYSLASIAKG